MKTVEDRRLGQVVWTVRQQVISVPIVRVTELARLAERNGGLSVAAADERRGR